MPRTSFPIVSTDTQCVVAIWSCHVMSSPISHTFCSSLSGVRHDWNNSSSTHTHNIFSLPENQNICIHRSVAFFVFSLPQRMKFMEVVRAPHVKRNEKKFFIKIIHISHCPKPLTCTSTPMVMFPLSYGSPYSFKWFFEKNKYKTENDSRPPRSITSTNELHQVCMLYPVYKGLDIEGVVLFNFLLSLPFYFINSAKFSAQKCTLWNFSLKLSVQEVMEATWAHFIFSHSPSTQRVHYYYYLLSIRRCGMCLGAGTLWQIIFMCSEIKITSCEQHARRWVPLFGIGTSWRLL